MKYGDTKTITHSVVIREDTPTGLSYDALVAAFERELGHWDQGIEGTLIEQHAPWDKVENAFQSMAGPHGLMIFFM